MLNYLIFTEWMRAMFMYFVVDGLLVVGEPSSEYLSASDILMKVLTTLEDHRLAAVIPSFVTRDEPEYFLSLRLESHQGCI